MELPKAFVSRLRSDLPLYADQLLAAIEASEPVVSLRLHPSKKNTLAWASTPIPWSPDGHWLKERPIFTADPAFHAGGYYVQESASMLLDAVLAKLPAPMRALDVAAAPGGKSTLLANHLAPGGWLLANDIVPKRAEILKSNLDKWGNSRVAVSNNTLSQIRGTGSLFDCILVDAPCSGEGMFRKDRDSQQHWHEDLPASCSVLQEGILAEALQLLAPGGYLIYSTCTFARVENEMRWLWLTERGLQPIDLHFPDEWGFLDVHTDFPQIPTGVAYRSVPGISRGEGFFICCFQKPGKSAFKETHSKLQVRESVGDLAFQLDEGLVLHESKSGTVYAGLASQFEWCKSAGKEVRILREGTALGHWQGKAFVPAHAGALAADVQWEAERIELNKQMALWYLSRSGFQLGKIPKGHFLLQYNELSLGWGFNKQDRFINCLPASEKIRMQL